MKDLPLHAAVAALRAQAGLSLNQLAERLGSSRGAVQGAERRGAGVTIKYLERVAAACGVQLVVRVDENAET